MISDAAVAEPIADRSGEQASGPLTISRLMRGFAPVYGLVFIHSIFIAVLALTPFLYMMQISERVYLSRSWETFWFITIIIVALMVIWAVLGWLRENALRSVGAEIDIALKGKVFEAVHTHPRSSAFRYLTDISKLRDGLTGNFVSAIFDSLLSPIFIIVLFIIHPVFALVAIGLILILAILTVLKNRLWNSVRAETAPLEEEALGFGLATARKADTIMSMNLLSGVRRKWESLQERATTALVRGKEQSGIIEGMLDLIRRGQLVIVIGTGAVLFLLDQITATAAFAAFIVMMRGVNPILSVVQNWQTVGEVRASFNRLDKLLADTYSGTKTPLPVPTGRLECNGVTLSSEQRVQILRNITFRLEPGKCLGVVGPSGAGKSSLLRLLAGSTQDYVGEITLDGYPLAQWPSQQIGDVRGYLPQEVDLFPGTVWENVARFMPYSASVNADVVEAVERAGALKMVQSLHDGFDTQLKLDGSPLSGGQRQRIGLARALFRLPRLCILDEPNSALDADGEAKLSVAIQTLKEANSTVILTTHKASLLDVCDHILVLMNGYVHSFSSRDDIMDRLRGAGQAKLLGSVEI